MAKIKAIREPDYGGANVCTDADDTAVYLHPQHALYLDWRKTGKISAALQSFVDGVIAQRQAGAAEMAKIAAVDAALDAEYQKRKAAVNYEKTGAEAVATVFPTVAEVKP